MGPLSRNLSPDEELFVKDRGYLAIAGLIVLAVMGDIMLNHARATLFLIEEIIALQEYLQFWR